jgi:hypothetical protein
MLLVLFKNNPLIKIDWEFFFLTSVWLDVSKKSLPLLKQKIKNKNPNLVISLEKVLKMVNNFNWFDLAISKNLSEEEKLAFLLKIIKWNKHQIYYNDYDNKKRWLFSANKIEITSLLLPKINEIDWIFEDNNNLKISWTIHIINWLFKWIPEQIIDYKKSYNIDNNKNFRVIKWNESVVLTWIALKNFIKSNDDIENKILQDNRNIKVDDIKIAKYELWLNKFNLKILTKYWYNISWKNKAWEYLINRKFRINDLIYNKKDWTIRNEKWKVLDNNVEKLTQSLLKIKKNKL